MSKFHLKGADEGRTKWHPPNASEEVYLISPALSKHFKEPVPFQNIHVKKSKTLIAACIPNVFGVKIVDDSIDEIVTHYNGSYRLPIAGILAQ